MPKNRVVLSFDNEAGDHCVDIFMRDDGTFGYEEYRRDHEDPRGWFSLQRHGSRSFPSEADALGHRIEDIAYDAAMGAFGSMPRQRRRDPEAVGEAVRRAIRAALSAAWNKKPTCHVHVLEV